MAHAQESNSEIIWSWLLLSKLDAKTCVLRIFDSSFTCNRTSKEKDDIEIDNFSPAHEWSRVITSVCFVSLSLKAFFPDLFWVSKANSYFNSKAKNKWQNQRQWLSCSLPCTVYPCTIQLPWQLDLNLEGQGLDASCSSHWWFGTCFIFPYIGNFIIPTDEVLFFRGVAQPPTSHPLIGIKLSFSPWEHDFGSMVDPQKGLVVHPPRGALWLYVVPLRRKVLKDSNSM